MLFNSLDFAIFVPIVFIIYWFVTNKNLPTQNFLILISSYFFYGCWDWRFLSLIFFSTLIDYFVGIALKKQKRENTRKFLVSISIICNLGLLCFFKYFNFFIENFITVFSLFGKNFGVSTLNIILPVGISFYTFQTMSYTIDVYKNKIEPTKDFISFAAFVAFFPQLVAGPIERAKNLLPQFSKERNFNYDKAVDGLKQTLWGLFKKMVIADNCGVFVDELFRNHTQYNGSSLLIGAFFFTVQIYCDFSGYSDIAIGVSRLFGFNLTKNFAFPYFSRNIKEFWRRWHISLTSWVKDYIYIPLGGSWGTKLMQVRNTILIFVIIGFWHGAHWKFIVYGLINALHFLPAILKGKSKRYQNVVAYNKWIPTVRETWGILRTFIFLVLVRVFFRASDLSEAISYLSVIFSKSLLTFPDFENKLTALGVVVLIVFFFLIEWLGRTNEYALEKLPLKMKQSYRWTFYYCIVFMIFYFSGKQQQFIYFQF
jgi:D-alanyl-lipoteichoic acid acyltransferase DltB (MBOAT superfamily)